MTTESPPRPYDVWQMSFEYEDQPGVAKVRPVVIGAVDGGRAVVLAVKVTGHGPRPEFPGEVRLRGWKDAGLGKPSVARCSKTLVVPTEAFAGQMRYGHLTRRTRSPLPRRCERSGRPCKCRRSATDLQVKSSVA